MLWWQRKNFLSRRAQLTCDHAPVAQMGLCYRAADSTIMQVLPGFQLSDVLSVPCRCPQCWAQRLKSSAKRASGLRALLFG